MRLCWCATLSPVPFRYVFLLHIHLNGRMLDSYRRINADDSAFFVPHDMEVSPAELQWIVAVAKAWRGPQGTQRKVPSIWRAHCRRQLHSQSA